MNSYWQSTVCMHVSSHREQTPAFISNQPVAAIHFIQLFLQPGTLLLFLLKLPLYHTELLLSFTLDIIGHNHCGLQISLKTPPLFCVFLERAFRTQNVCCKNAPMHICTYLSWALSYWSLLQWSQATRISPQLQNVAEAKLNTCLVTQYWQDCQRRNWCWALRYEKHKVLPTVVDHPDLWYYHKSCCWRELIARDAGTAAPKSQKFIGRKSRSNLAKDELYFPFMGKETARNEWREWRTKGCRKNFLELF